MKNIINDKLYETQDEVLDAVVGLVVEVTKDAAKGNPNVDLYEGLFAASVAMDRMNAARQIEQQTIANLIALAQLPDEVVAWEVKQRAAFAAASALKVAS